MLPERRGSSFGHPRAHATLCMKSDSHGEERISIPIAVGKQLTSRQEKGDLMPDSRAEFLYLVRETSLKLAFQRIERLVNKRDYSLSEMKGKLTLDGYAPSVIDEVLSKALDARYLDDSRYASAFIRSKLSAGWGNMRISRELSRRGIDINEVPGWPEGFLDDDNEDERALQVARNRRLSSKNPYEKLVRYLCGRGFSLSCSMRAAGKVMAEVGERF